MVRLGIILISQEEGLSRIGMNILGRIGGSNENDTQAECVHSKRNIVVSWLLFTLASRALFLYALYISFLLEQIRLLGTGVA